MAEARAALETSFGTLLKSYFLLSVSVEVKLWPSFNSDTWCRLVISSWRKIPTAEVVWGVGPSSDTWAAYAAANSIESASSSTVSVTLEKSKVCASTGYRE